LKDGSILYRPAKADWLFLPACADLFDKLIGEGHRAREDLAARLNVNRTTLNRGARSLTEMPRHA